jgi:hypothetical protein
MTGLGGLQNYLSHPFKCRKVKIAYFTSVLACAIIHIGKN